MAAVDGTAAGGVSCEVVLYLLEAGESPAPVATDSPVLFVGDEWLGDSRGAASVLSRGGEPSFLPRGCSRRELRAALAAVAAGLLVRHPGNAAAPPASRRAPGLPEGQAGFRGDWGSQGSDRITERERQVLIMIAEGLPNKTIAAELGITSHTVKFHIASIMQKLGAASRTEAVTLGVRRGIIFL